MMSSKPTTKTEIEDFAIKLTDESPDHDAWLSIVRYGLGTFLANQPLMIEVIFRESQKQMQRNPGTSRKIADEARAIFDELGLRLEVASRD